MIRFFIIITIFSGSLYAQVLKIVATLQSTDRNSIDYINDEGRIINSFVIDSLSIYMGEGSSYYPFYMWNYKLPFSSSNPKKLYGFLGYAIKKDRDIIISASMNVLNIKTLAKQAILFGQDKGIDTDPTRVWFSTSDSILYYFSYSYPDRTQLVSFIYDLKQSKNKPKQLFNFISHVMTVHGRMSDVFVLKNKLISIYDVTDMVTKKSYYTLVCWDIESDSLVNESSFDQNLIMPQICGLDSHNNIYICSAVGYDGAYTLWIISPQFKILQEVDIDSLISNMSFMKNNHLCSLEPDFGPVIVGAFDDNKELYFMVKTIKGLFFLKYNSL